MKKELLDTYHTLFFNKDNDKHDLKVYAIVDSLRDESVTEKVMLLHQKEYIDLWHDELIENPQEVPLYLVELSKEDKLTSWLLSNHHKSIATYFLSPYSLDELQSYYSTFTYPDIEVEKDNFKKAIFGFYDPNILSNYIQTLYTEEKVDEFFVGVAIWLVPSVDNEDSLYIVYRSKDGEVDDVNLLLSNFTEENAILNFDDISLPTLANLEEYAHEINIDQVQVKMFDDVAKTRFINGIFKEYKTEGQMFYHSEETNKELAFNLFDEAKNINIVSEAGIYRYILLGLTVLRPMNELKFYRNIINTPDEASKIKIMDDIMNKIIEKRREVNGK